MRYLPLLLGITLPLFFSACSGQKKARKYDYLLENRQTTSSRPPVGTSPPAASPPATAHTPSSRPAPPRPKALTPKARPTRPKRPIASTGTAPTGSLSGSQVSTVLETARSYTGTPYRYGGMSRKGIDCSGLVCNAFQAIDWKLPHSSQSLAASGTEVSQQQIYPGNLVFFNAKNSRGINHVGLVSRISGGTIYFLHATVSGGVREDNLANSYWQVRFRKAIQL